MKLRVWIREIILGEIVIALLAYIWYDSIYYFLFLQVLMVPFLKYCSYRRLCRWRRQCQLGFYDFLQSLLSSLQAGYSLENACISAYDELVELHGRNDAFVGQMEILIQGLRVHIPLEDLFHDMAQETANEDIRQFAVVMEIVKNMGGNSVEVLRNAMYRIQKKMETSEEIHTLLSGKIYEKNLMLLMPFFMILYLKIMNGTYLELLYHTLQGQAIMTAALIGIIGCFFWTENIMKITF